MAGTWKKSTRCESHACVEVALPDKNDDVVRIRNNGEPDVSLEFPIKSWGNFLKGVTGTGFVPSGQEHPLEVAEAIVAAEAATIEANLIGATALASNVAVSSESI